MQRHKSLRPLRWGVLAAACIVLFAAVPLWAAPFLTDEERAYIAARKTVQAVNVEGAAPIQYRDGRGRVRGISQQILQEIAEMTGLSFEYELTATPQEVWESGAELIVGIPPNYAPPGLRLSPPFLVSETILFFNSSLDFTDLAGKRYAGVKGGALPEGVREENALYYETREEALTAVDGGMADYGYGNAYSVAFYQLQNDYNNLVTVPQGKEGREYCIGYLNADPLLVSIIDKAVAHVDERRLQSMILEVASGVERKITPAMIAHLYGGELIVLISLIFALLAGATAILLKLNKELKQRNRIHDVLSQISNEYLYEYDVKSGRLNLSKKFTTRLGSEQNAAEVRAELKKRLSAAEGAGTFEIMASLEDGRRGVFKVVSTEVEDTRSKTGSIVGKLIDISRVAAEREKLIAKAEMDGPTGLYNASTTKELIAHSLKDREGRSLDALLVIDCDSLKQINDTYGHLMGDKALQHIARSLVKVFRGTDVIGRIGGDEFAVFMKDVPSGDFVREKCSQLHREIEQNTDDAMVTVSIGLALIEQEESYDTAFARADQDLYRAKRERRGMGA